MNSRINPLLRHPPNLRLHPLITRKHISPSPIPSRYQSTNSSPNFKIQRFLARLPPRLRPYVAPLAHAPISHITTFLILHELTAVIPLIGLSIYFHYFHILPQSLVESENVKKGVEKFTRYFERKGWFGFGNGTDVGKGKNELMGRDALMGDEIASFGNEDDAVQASGREGTRIVMEIACAYAITKVLLPLRLIVSVWATPVVAGFGIRFLEGWRRNAARNNTSSMGNSYTNASSTKNTGGLGPDSKAPPGENQQVFLMSIKLFVAAGALFGISRLFAKRPLGPEQKFKPTTGGTDGSSRPSIT